MAGRSPVAFARRFWEKVDKRRSDECWPWLAHVNNRGFYAEGPGRRLFGGDFQDRLSSPRFLIQATGLEQAATRANAAVSEAVEDLNRVPRLMTYEYPIT
jgi:hypothetical protein